MQLPIPARDPRFWQQSPHISPRGLLLTLINFNPGLEITPIMKYEMKLLIHSQTLTVQALKFCNGQVISFHTLLVI